MTGWRSGGDKKARVLHVQGSARTKVPRLAERSLRDGKEPRKVARPESSETFSNIGGSRSTGTANLAAEVSIFGHLWPRRKLEYLLFQLGRQLPGDQLLVSARPSHAGDTAAAMPRVLPNHPCRTCRAEPLVQNLPCGTIRADPSSVRTLIRVRPLAGTSTAGRGRCALP